ncbi:DNA polymerase III subunit gamma/tau [Candidatus Gracilibacteria bacterium 28_42_T64]|nr:DNA polymerase III subunit gamma/tau [Candidatus Gracilibacteria bacterium 28_42_T64]
MSLYLKYRPSDFDNLVGQDFINKTLKKAIADDKTVGAYLLCGPRGTGKTTTARILAKTVNCENIKEGNPCLECGICKDFQEEKLIDIIEIDAASHTGVDNIREIIEKAQFRPTRTKYKIYIIDEVHMLSKGAFNALLKILEEPPEHVKFILATTETHKVPDTIISRCQRYDFKRINDLDVKNRLSYIAKQEDITVDDKSYDYIVKNSGGGLRDAISLFEQLVEDKIIEYDVIISKLGIVGDEILDIFLKKLLNNDSSITDDLDELIQNGKNVKLFFKELIFYIKDKSIIELKTGNNISEYIKILDTLDDTYVKTKYSLDENTTFLIGILKIITGFSGIDTPVKQEQNTKKQNINIVKKSETQPVQKLEQKDELSHSDIDDVFGTPTPESTAIKTDTTNPGNTSSFDSKGFIDTLKAGGAKGGLTMALRGSDLGLELSTLKITTKTKIAYSQIGSTDNIALMTKTLSDMGVQNPEINIS